MKSDFDHPNKGKQRKRLKGLLGKASAFIVLILVISLGMLLILWIQTPSENEGNVGIEELTETDSLKLSSDLDGKERDPETDLVIGEGFEIVKGHCTACHSSALVIQNKFTREGWKAKIEWMQETQGLWELGESEPIILDYLAKHYAPEAYVGRRAPLKDIEWYELDSSN